MAEEQQQEQVMDTTESTETAGAAAATVGDEDDRKLFVGGLPQDAKDHEIKEYFGTFGEIVSINLKTDPHTGRSRGFAFVVFSTVASLEAAVSAPEHLIKSKKVAVKKAQAKQGKVYVGKLKNDITDEDIKGFFSQYGSVASVEQPFDKMKNERKNFCFITFDKEEPAKKLLKEGSVTLKGYELEIKKVTPKPDPRAMGGPMFGGSQGRGGGQGGRGGGQGGPWGGYPGGGQWGGYGGDYWGGYGGYGADPYYGGGGQWGGYGGGWGGYGGQGGGFAGGKTPRGRGAPRGGRGGPGGARGGGQRQKPY